MKRKNWVLKKQIDRGIGNAMHLMRKQLRVRKEPLHTGACGSGGGGGNSDSGSGTSC